MILWPAACGCPGRVWVSLGPLTPTSPIPMDEDSQGNICPASNHHPAVFIPRCIVLSKPCWRQRSGAWAAGWISG